MMRLMAAVCWAMIPLGCGGPDSAEDSTSSNELAGVWRVTMLEFQSPTDSSINSDPQPGQAIFSDSSYSLVWMPGSGMRSFQERWMPTDAEKIERYGQIVVNSGMYSIENDSLMTLHPLVSRVPEFMGGGTLTYVYRLSGDTLQLTSLDEYSFDGVQAPWAAARNLVTLTLERVEDLRRSR